MHQPHMTPRPQGKVGAARPPRPTGRLSLPGVLTQPIPAMDGSIGRKQLSHEIPLTAMTGPEDEVFFVTICCLPRGINQLAWPEVWRKIDDSLQHRESVGDMHVRLVLAMPDHLHGLFSFCGKKPMAKVIADFKSWVAKSTGVRWQRDFFDHRLRGLETASEKANYIRNNPVRAGLVSQCEDWPYHRVAISLTAHQPHMTPRPRG